ncbi:MULTISPECIES: ankyrin repeat domain-containing protein [unclassified Endozoicomonas]|uniref:ankyrin repeat domain-containing protein n=1 Tax=unclassified Endozoicomonas TaxID=2644528 RepID=UPI003BB73604
MKTPSYLAASATLAAFIHCNTTMAWTSVRANSDSVRPNSKVLQLYRNSADGDEINYIYFDIDKRRLLWKVAKNAGHEETYEQPLPDFIGSVSASVFKGNHLYIAGQLQYKQEWFISALNPNGEVIWVRQGNDNDPSGMPKDITFYKIMTMAEEKVIYAVGKTPSTQIVLELNSENGSDVSGEVFNKFSNRKLLHTSSNSTDDEVISSDAGGSFRILEWIAGIVTVLGVVTLGSVIYGVYEFYKNLKEERKARITHAKDIESNRRKIEGDLIRKMARQQTSLLFMPPDSSVVMPDISVIDNPEVNTDADRAKQEQLFTHLQNEVRQGNVEKVGNLLESSRDLINQLDSFGNTLLHVAATQGDASTLEALLNAGADIEILNNQQHSPLHLAIINNYPEAVKLLIESPARISERLRIINQEDSQGNTPLHLAVLARNTKVVTLLLSNGASQERSNNYGFTPLYLAAINGTQDAIKVLLDWKSAISQDEVSALFHIAANFNSESLMEGLLIRGLHHGFKFYQPCMPDTMDQFCVQTESGLTVLHEAVLANSYSVVRLLIRVGLIKINAQDDQGNTSLHYAIQNNDMEMIEILLSAGAGINIMNGLGYTPLHLAVQLENQVIVDYLLNEDKHKDEIANPNIRAQDGRTPLDIAFERGLLKMVRALGPITWHNTLPKENKIFHTIIHRMFVLQGIDHAELLQTLYEHDPYLSFDKNMQDFSGNTPLHVALEMGLDQASVLFIRLYKPALNIQNNEGQTPLHVALRYGNQKAIEFLIEKGADLQLTDNNNESVLDLATSIGNVEAASLIRNKIEGSKTNGTKSDSEQKPPVVIEL